MIVAGLTGSIAMGKSEATRIFRSMGIPVFDSDAEVHRLYSEDATAVAAVGKLLPRAIVDSVVDRKTLSMLAFGNPQALRKLESVIHPLIRERENAFIAERMAKGAEIVVLDVPLLFETGRETEFDAIIVVSAPRHIQRTRALQRPGMTEEKLEQILDRQMPDDVKRSKADFVVDTSLDIDHTTAQLRAIVEQLLMKAAPPQP